MKFKLNSKGVRELLHREELANHLKSLSEGVKQRAGEGYEAEVVNVNSKTRVVATIRVGDARSYRDNLKHNTLMKALQ